MLAPVELRDWCEQQGLGGSGMDPNKGGTVDLDGFTVTLVHAQHSSTTPAGVSAGEPCGLVLDAHHGPTFYFAGDTNVFGDMALIARIYEPDVAVLPIGGHYTMDPREASFALELLRTPRCVPCHYGTFPILAGTPAKLREHVAALGLDVDVLEPQPGETLTL